MLHCAECKIDITGAPERCPLCGGPLTGEADPQGGLFTPLPDRRRERDLIFRLITMTAIVTIVVSLAVDYLLDGHFRWSLFISGGSVCAWVFSVIGWIKRHELAKNIFLQTTLVSVVGLIWDWSTGWHGWSLDYVIPCACVAAIAALGVLVVVLQLESSDYMIYLLTVSVYGVAPLVFLFTGAVRVRYPSVICSALCFLTIIALLLFFRKNTLEELQRKFHI